MPPQNQPAGRRMPPAMVLLPPGPSAVGRVPADSIVSAEEWRERHRRSHPELSDLLASQALLQAMAPGWEAEVSAESLVGLAAREPAALRHALFCIQSRNQHCPTPATQRAVQALRRAVDGPSTSRRAP